MHEEGVVGFCENLNDLKEPDDLGRRNDVPFQVNVSLQVSKVEIGKTSNEKLKFFEVEDRDQLTGHQFVEASEEHLNLILHFVVHLILGKQLNVLFFVLLCYNLLVATYTKVDLFRLTEVFLIVGESHFVIVEFILECVCIATVQDVL